MTDNHTLGIFFTEPGRWVGSAILPSNGDVPHSFFSIRKFQSPQSPKELAHFHFPSTYQEPISCGQPGIRVADPLSKQKESQYESRYLSDFVRVAHERRMVFANNMANINTAGFKRTSLQNYLPFCHGAIPVGNSTADWLSRSWPDPWGLRNVRLWPQHMMKNGTF